MLFLTGSPTITYYNMDPSTINKQGSKAWDLIEDAKNKKFVMSASVSRKRDEEDTYGLPNNHAYTILGTAVIKTPTGDDRARLIRIRNPWGVDSYNGPWNDNDNRWNAMTMPQVPDFKKANDGTFFIEENDFVKAFSRFDISEMRDDFIVKYTEVLGDDGSKKQFSINVMNKGPVNIGMEFYNPRMYPKACKTGTTLAIAELLLNGKIIKTLMAKDYEGFNNMYFENL